MESISTIILAICGILSSFLTIYFLIFKSGKKESNVNGRISDLESHYENISKDIVNIKENHLSHIQNDISAINISLAEIKTTLKIKLAEK